MGGVGTTLAAWLLDQLVCVGPPPGLNESGIAPNPTRGVNAARPSPSPILGEWGRGGGHLIVGIAVLTGMTNSRSKNIKK